MRRLHVGAHFTVFLLFFGLALIEALQSGNWVLVLLWAAIGLAFFWEDSTGPSQAEQKKGRR